MSQKTSPKAMQPNELDRRQKQRPQAVANRGGNHSGYTVPSLHTAERSPTSSSHTVGFPSLQECFFAFPAFPTQWVVFLFCLLWFLLDHCKLRSGHTKIRSQTERGSTINPAEEWKIFSSEDMPRSRSEQHHVNTSLMCPYVYFCRVCFKKSKKY